MSSLVSFFVVSFGGSWGFENILFLEMNDLKNDHDRFDRRRSFWIKVLFAIHVNEWDDWLHVIPHLVIGRLMLVLESQCEIIDSSTEMSIKFLFSREYTTIDIIGMNPIQVDETWRKTPKNDDPNDDDDNANNDQIEFYSHLQLWFHEIHFDLNRNTWGECVKGSKLRPSIMKRGQNFLMGSLFVVLVMIHRLLLLVDDSNQYPVVIYMNFVALLHHLAHSLARIVKLTEIRNSWK